MEMKINPRRIVRVLFWIIVALGVLGTLSQILVHIFEGGYWLRLAYRLDLDGNWSVPIYYSALALMLAAVLFFVNAHLTKARKGRFVKHWYFASGMFVFMSFDEAIGIHGLMNNPMNQTFNLPEWMTLPWVIPAMILVVVVALAYLPMVMSLSPPVRIRFFLAGGVFIGGAVGMETVGMLMKAYFPEQPAYYTASAIIEEMMEKFGILILIDALLRHLVTMTDRIEIRLSPDPPYSSSGESETTQSA
ncbi:MAG: hypothetical protein EA377_03655 [Phycisphaerales bacterium]|nr:MAG: hypothetical protein EA377_03655 [Phycisphaerales bacterium]